MKIKASFEIEKETWHSFRKHCMDRNTTASKTLRKYINDLIKGEQ